MDTQFFDCPVAESDAGAMMNKLDGDRPARPGSQHPARPGSQRPARPGSQRVAGILSDQASACERIRARLSVKRQSTPSALGDLKAENAAHSLLIDEVNGPLFSAEFNKQYGGAATNSSGD
ncbi:hypothetical protein [Devosia sp.]|uniref:hypothetical protein n=1 Tax=Devosia sp. TaxID=1871048 RepID=UPI0027325F68|nr:hypothetical protein [Devosia sp.]MDP2779155.1 hypothetical protein [Devosia sp.]